MEIESQRLDFLTLIIHIINAQDILEHIREGRKKKKKNQKNPGRHARPGLRVTWVTRDAWAARDATAEEFWRFCFLSFAFFYLAFCLAAQKIIKFGSLCFSLRSDGCVLDFLSFFFFVYFGLYERLEPLMFFKFSWYKSSFRHSIST